VYVSSDVKKIAEYKKQEQENYNSTQNTPALMAAREREK
jgi:hypothetical protein